MFDKQDEFYMRQALQEAEEALLHDDVPVGAVVVYKENIIGRGHNQVEELNDPTAHAEMLAITAATQTLKSKWLQQAKMYVTIEPCSMCAGALVLARLKEVIFGAFDPKAGACGSVVNIAHHQALNHRLKIKAGLLREECSALLKEFFKKKRKRG